MTAQVLRWRKTGEVPTENEDVTVRISRREPFNQTYDFRVCPLHEIFSGATACLGPLTASESQNETDSDRP